MPEPISKIESISTALLKPVSTGSGTRVLPALNSFVDIKILEVMKNNVRMLIGGRVFISSFPGQAYKNENFIARVVNLNPFTLSLNLAGIKAGLTETELTMLIARLNLPDTLVSRKIIRSLIAEKKAVEKSKLEELVEYLEEQEIDPDEQQLMILLRASGNSDFKKYLSDTDRWIFKSSVETVADEIFNSVTFLIKSELSEEIHSAIIESLIIDPSNTQDLIGFILLQQDGQLNKLIKALASFKSDLISDPSVLKDFIKLKENLFRYKTLQKIYSDAGIYPGIMIVKQNNNYELIKYGFQKEIDKEDKVYKIKIDTSPENLGEIKINSFIGSGSVLVDFHTSKKTIDYMRITENGLSERLKSNLNISPFIKYSQLKPGSTKFKGSESVNVKI